METYILFHDEFAKLMPIILVEELYKGNALDNLNRGRWYTLVTFKPN